jgi:hypothetical protein
MALFSSEATVALNRRPRARIGKPLATSQDFTKLGRNNLDGRTSRHKKRDLHKPNASQRMPGQEDQLWRQRV